MFERIVTDPYYAAQYEIKVLSRPDYAEGDDPEQVDYIIGPWVATLDNFLTEQEAERLIELGRNVGYERSTDVGEVFEDGSVERKLSTGRTSENAWCLSDECLDDPVANAVYDRMENLTSIPSGNSEALQLLQYKPGQFYKNHHDYIPLDRERKQGVRILTVFLYLVCYDQIHLLLVCCRHASRLTPFLRIYFHSTTERCGEGWRHRLSSPRFDGPAQAGTGLGLAEHSE